MKFRRQRREELSVNLTPLIDVVFLLLIFFMVSTTFTRETQLSIDLPEASGQPQETTDERIEILIDESGSYRVQIADSYLEVLNGQVDRLEMDKLPHPNGRPRTISFVSWCLEDSPTLYRCLISGEDFMNSRGDGNREKVIQCKKKCSI